jgi:hypothetical protein
VLTARPVACKLSLCAASDFLTSTAPKAPLTPLNVQSELLLKISRRAQLVLQESTVIPQLTTRTMVKRQTVTLQTVTYADLEPGLLNLSLPVFNSFRLAPRHF